MKNELLKVELLFRDNGHSIGCYCSDTAFNSDLNAWDMFWNRAMVDLVVAIWHSCYQQGLLKYVR